MPPMTAATKARVQNSRRRCERGAERERERDDAIDEMLEVLLRRSAPGGGLGDEPAHRGAHAREHGPAPPAPSAARGPRPAPARAAVLALVDKPVTDALLLVPSNENPAWRATAPLPYTLYRDATATLLPNGRVLVVGSRTPRKDLEPAALLFDPAEEKWSEAATPPTTHNGHRALLLPDGRVLVVGGTLTIRGQTQFAAPELYDPKTDQWADAGKPVRLERWRHSAVLLPDGRLLVTGGGNGGKMRGNDVPELEGATELYDPKTNTWAAAAALHAPRGGANLVRVGDRALLIGGRSGNSRPPIEIFDAALARWVAATPVERLEEEVVLPFGARKLITAPSSIVIDTSCVLAEARGL